MMDSTFCLDARTVHPHFPGVGRYAASLAVALAACIDASEQLVVLRDSGQSSAWPPADTMGAHVQIVDVPLSPFSVRQQWVVPHLLRHLGVTLYHSPYYMMPFWPGVPTVVTLHDLIPLRYPHLFTREQRLVYRIATRLAVRAARRVVTVSAAAAQDISDLLRVPAERVVVIPAAADPTFRPQSASAIAATRGRLSLPPRYALYVGTNKPHKNLVRLIEAWARVHVGDATLVIAGVWDARFPEAQRRAAALGVSDSVHFLGRVAEADLPALYAGALLFVFPSEHEGFGLPVIEAMACGVPVACSSAASLAEVAGEAALHFAPHDVESMAAAIGALLADTDLRAEMSRRGTARAAQFSWATAAHLTLAVYRDVSRNVSA